ncbi:MAG TPA: hypothetical protein O0X97_05525 [Methanocorpusculum sp.]|nr:hypothetical protein [Methanocorpusculum sp.]
MYIDAAGRSKINSGDACYFVLDGLAQAEFGTIDAVIEQISSDATLTEDAVVFKTYAAFDETQMKNRRGEAVNIVNGMRAKVWVVVEKMSYWNYFM